MDHIQSIFNKTAIRRDNMWMYFIKDAVNVIKECEKELIILHGIDAFILNGKGIQPSMENSLWFKTDSKDNYKAAIEFLEREENSPYVYEVWYEGY
jgi:hypothetical protein